MNHESIVDAIRYQIDETKIILHRIDALCSLMDEPLMMGGMPIESMDALSNRWIKNIITSTVCIMFEAGSTVDDDRCGCVVVS